MIRILLLLSTFLTIKAYSQENNLSKFQKNTINGTFYGVKKNNNEIIPALYDEVGNNNIKYFAVKKNGKWGIIDSNNKTIINFNYDIISLPFEDRLFVGKGEKLALADVSGKLITGYIYDNIYDFSSGLACVVSDKFMGFIDKNGKNIIKIHKTDELVPYCQNGYVVVKKKGKESLAIANSMLNDKSNEIVIDLTESYFFVYNNQGNLIFKSDAGEKVEIAKNRNIIATNLGGSFTANRLRIINTQKKIIYEINYNYEAQHDYENEFINFYNGVVNTNGIELIKPNFDEITTFKYNQNNLAKVFFKKMSTDEERKYFYIDKNFKCVEFDNIKCPE